MCKHTGTRLRAALFKNRKLQPMQVKHLLPETNHDEVSNSFYKGIGNMYQNVM